MRVFSQWQNTLIICYFIVSPCASLFTMEWQSMLMGCPVVWPCLDTGEGALRCSFSLSPKVLPDSPIYFSSMSAWVHLNHQITPLFCVMLSLSFGATHKMQMVLLPLKCTCVHQTIKHKLVPSMVHMWFVKYNIFP